ncbi:hypothetical protein ASD21_03905 [Caulobacter sp. Root1455]|nr:hypothetical protein ASD21_03905 [Caulobacter sp. Root1455]
MSSDPDLVGTVFFTVCAGLMLCLTWWPRLWIVLAVDRRRTADDFGRRRGILRVLTGLGALLCVSLAVAMYLGF